MRPTKKQVIAHIEAYLADQLSAVADSPLEEKQLKAADLSRQLQMYRFLPTREFDGEGEVICPAALVELDLDGVTTFCFIVPQGGGLVMKVEGAPVQVVTPSSPLGEALLGHKSGDSIEVEGTTRTRRYRVVSFS